MAHSTPTKVRRYIADLSNSYLECRRLGHSWQHDVAVKVGVIFVQTLRCSTCDATKTEYIDRWGDVGKRTMSYPRDYLARGLGRSLRGHKSDMRIEMLNRVGWADEPEDN